MARKMHFPPVPNSEGEVVGFFHTLESGVLRQVRELLDDTVSHSLHTATEGERL